MHKGHTDNRTIALCWIPSDIPRLWSWSFSLHTVTVAVISTRALLVSSFLVFFSTFSFLDVDVYTPCIIKVIPFQFAIPTKHMTVVGSTQSPTRPPVCKDTGKDKNYSTLETRLEGKTSHGRCSVPNLQIITQHLTLEKVGVQKEGSMFIWSPLHQTG